MSEKRVLIFDSGVGGLSVYQEIMTLNPTIKCHYLFDNAYFPYGELPRLQLVERLIQLLSHFMNQYPADLIVIACNSASTVALTELRAHFAIPIVGVVPAIKPAAKLTQNNIIGLLATPGTIERAYTDHLVEKFAIDKQVLRIGSTRLVQLAEDKLIGKSLINNEVKNILLPWLVGLQTPDTLVLGCTHFPLLKEEISACFNHQVKLVDSGKAIAMRVQQLLGVNSQVLPTKKGEHDAFYTQPFNNATRLSALTKSFHQYGFNQLNHYST